MHTAIANFFYHVEMTKGLYIRSRRHSWVTEGQQMLEGTPRLCPKESVANKGPQPQKNQEYEVSEQESSD